MSFGSWIGLRFGQSATGEIFVIEKASAGRSLRWPKCRLNPEPKIEADLAKVISGITILDTNVVSEPMQPLPSATVAAWLSQQPSGALIHHHRHGSRDFVRYRTLTARKASRRSPCGG